MENKNIPDTNEQMPKPQSMKNASKKLNVLLYIGLGLFLVGLLLGDSDFGAVLMLISIIPNVIGFIQTMKHRRNTKQ